MSDNPFAAQSSGAMKFVICKAFATPVKLVSGASYTIPGVLDREGNDKLFNGKQKVEKSDLFHVVLDYIGRTKDGATYHMVKHYLSKDKDYSKHVYPAYSKMFGADLGRLAKDYTALQVQETDLGRKFTGSEGNEIELVWLKPIQIFDNEKALRAAEESYFSNNGNADSSDSSEPTPAAFDPSEWTKALPEIEKAIKDKTKELKSADKATAFVLNEYELTSENLEAIRKAAK